MERLLAASIASGAAADTLKKVSDAGRITLGYRESSVPFSYIAGVGKPVGFSMDIADSVVRELKRRTGKVLEVEYVPVTSQNRIPLLTNGTIDLECCSTTNNSTRGKDVAFAINHFYTGTRLLVKKTGTFATTRTWPAKWSPRRPAPPMHRSCASTTPRGA